MTLCIELEISKNDLIQIFSQGIKTGGKLAGCFWVYIFAQCFPKLFKSFPTLLGSLNWSPSDSASATTRDEFRRMVVEENHLHKATISSRKLTLRRLREIYTLESAVILRRVFRRYLGKDNESFFQLALLLGLAREPLLRATLPVIMDMRPGDELTRDALRASLVKETDGRLEPKSLELHLSRTTLRDETDLKAWLTQTEARIREALRQGPVVLQ